MTCSLQVPEKREVTKLDLFRALGFPLRQPKAHSQRGESNPVMSFAPKAAVVSCHVGNSANLEGDSILFTSSTGQLHISFPITVFCSSAELEAADAEGAKGGFGLSTGIIMRIEEYFCINITALDDVLSDHSLQPHPCKTSDSSYCLNER